MSYAGASAMPKKNAAPEGRTRSLWSGVLSFGLVSIPVELHSVVRPSPVRMRMLGPDGVPLSRRYRCPAHDRLLESNEIVRGHTEEDGTFLIVTDEELESLDPKGSREIDLKSFVPRPQLSPRLFERAYILLPSGQSAKAYRLLAHTIEVTNRVGIASFVMRGRTYTIAITAQRGLMRAATLRDAQEIREPEDVGLSSAPSKADPKRVKAFEEAMASMATDHVDLRDRNIEAILQRAQEKQTAGDVLTVELPEESDSDSKQSVVDLMQLLKERLAAPEHASTKTPRAAHPTRILATTSSTKAGKPSTRLPSLSTSPGGAA